MSGTSVLGLPFSVQTHMRADPRHSHQSAAPKPAIDVFAEKYGAKYDQSGRLPNEGLVSAGRTSRRREVSNARRSLPDGLPFRWWGLNRRSTAIHAGKGQPRGYPSILEAAG
jgi:hypothetical protein